MSKVGWVIVAVILLGAIYVGFNFVTGSVAVTSEGAKSEAMATLNKIKEDDQRATEVRKEATQATLAAAKEGAAETAEEETAKPAPAASQEQNMTDDNNYRVKLETTKGDVIIEVEPDWAPIGAEQFRKLVEAGYFDGQKFFRVVEGFVVQFGLAADPADTQVWGNRNLQDEPVKASNVRGTITYAKSSAPNSRSTQVFINLNDNTNLDAMGFAPFGVVVEGMDVVESFHAGYGDSLTNRQGEIRTQGNAFLDRVAPELDTLVKATIVGEGSESEATEASEASEGGASGDE